MARAMIINYIYLISALLIGLAPAIAPQILVKESARKTMVHRHENPHEPIIRHWAYWGNWVNLLKGFLCGYLLWNGAFAFDEKKQGSQMIALVALNAPLFLTLVVQMIRTSKGRLVLLAPSLFASGFVLATGEVFTGCFAVIASWIFAWAARDIRILLPTMAVLLGVSEFLVNGKDLISLGRAPILMMPFVVGIFLQKSLIEIRAPNKIITKI
jgi:hypothetical protein